MQGASSCEGTMWACANTPSASAGTATTRGASPRSTESPEPRPTVFDMTTKAGIDSPRSPAPPPEKPE